MSDFEIEETSSGGGSFFANIPTILAARWKLAIGPTIAFAAAGVAAAFLLPISYTSSATLLVQSASLPVNVSGADASDLIDRRIARIREQLLSRPQLIELVNRYQLYPKERAEGALSEITEKMRKAVVIVPQTSSIQQGSNGSSTIAFSLDYSYSDATKAQAVAQDLVEQMLQLDATGNTQQASATVQFLTDQSRSLQRQIADLENQIAAVKLANGSILSSAGVTMLGNGAGGYDMQIAALQRENAAMILQRQQIQESADRDPIVNGAEQALAAAQAVYSDDHPDVKLARQRLAEAKTLAGKNIAKIPLAGLDQQVAFNKAQIASLRSQQANDSARISATLGAQSRAPAVIQQIAQLQQRLDGYNEQAKGVSDRLMQAQAGVKAENEQLGERLAVVDPPVVPDEPTFPNRWLFSGGGLAAGLLAGLVLMFAVELFRHPIRDPGTLTDIVGQAPLGVIPTIRSKAPKKGRGWRFWRRKG